MRVGLAADFYYPWIGGPSTLLRNLATGLAERGHEVSLLVPSPTGPGYHETVDAVPITRASTLPFPVGHDLRVAATPWRAADTWLQTFRPDVVHAHHPFPLSASAMLLARRRGIPVLATNHTIPASSLWGLRDARVSYRITSDLLGRWIVWLMARATSVATPTRTAAAELRAMGFAGSVDVISNGIDTERFQPGPPDERLMMRLGVDNRPTVLYTGRLDADKQMDVWLRATQRVAAERDIQLVVGGEGADRSELERMARSLGLGERTRFIGYVSGDELPVIYRLASVYCITSPVELQSISTLEALASGLPVVAANAGALPELVQDGVNGFLFPAGDDRAAALGLGQILSSAELRARQSDAARRTSLRHHLAQSIDAYERLLRTTAERARGTQRSERAAFPGR
ncbi:MAG TPA: glycosyltransferase [Chloroflexota bacterium]|nr:glycosyltransferase [Chloroflexota bacterium]